MKSCTISSANLNRLSYLWRAINYKFLHTSAQKLHGEYEMKDPTTPEETVHVTFVDKENNRVSVNGKIGDRLLYLAHKFNVEMEGACEASCACTTCHCYVDYKFLSKLPEASETEEDLLDMAPFLKENSRLGCQIILNKELDGIVITLPLATRNFYVDGHKPKPH